MSQGQAPRTPLTFCIKTEGSNGEETISLALEELLGESPTSSHNHNHEMSGTNSSIPPQTQTHHNQHEQIFMDRHNHPSYEHSSSTIVPPNNNQTMSLLMSDLLSTGNGTQANIMESDGNGQGTQYNLSSSGSSSQLLTLYKSEPMDTDETDQGLSQEPMTNQYNLHDLLLLKEEGDDCAGILGVDSGSTGNNSNTLTLMSAPPEDDENVLYTTVEAGGTQLNSINIKVESNNTSTNSVGNEDEDEPQPLDSVSPSSVSSQSSCSLSGQLSSENPGSVGSISGSSESDVPPAELSMRRRFIEEINRRSIVNLENRKYISSFMKDNIEEYILRRGFQYPSPIPVKISKGIFASTIQSDSFRRNSILFGPRYESSEIVETVREFWEFYINLKEVNSKLSQELKPVLCPILFYFFQELLFSKCFNIALQLFNQFANSFLTEDGTIESYRIMTWLSKINPQENTQQNDLLNQLRRKEYHFVFSEKLFHRLKSFLKKPKLQILRDLFVNRFGIQMEASNIAIENFLEVPTPSLPCSSKSYHCPGTITKEIIPKRKPCPADRVIAAVRHSVEANVPEIFLHTISGKPLCAAVSREGTLLAFGMKSSQINMCFTSQEALEKQNSSVISKRLLKNPVKRKHDSQVKEHNERALEDESLDKFQMINPMHGHDGPVYDVAFHPRIKLLLSVGHDGTLRAWDLNTFKCKVIYRGHDGPIWCVDVSETGHMIATGSVDKTARIWLLESTDYVRIFVGHRLDVECVKFHPNEAYLATGSLDKTVRLWSVTDGNILRVFSGSFGSISSIAFHESGEFLVGGGEDSTIRVWDIAESEILAELPCTNDGKAPCTGISLYKNMLVGAFNDNTIRIWNLLDLVDAHNEIDNEIALTQMENETISSSCSDMDEQGQDASPGQSCESQCNSENGGDVIFNNSGPMVMSPITEPPPPHILVPESDLFPVPIVNDFAIETGSPSLNLNTADITPNPDVGSDLLSICKETLMEQIENQLSFEEGVYLPDPETMDENGDDNESRSWTTFSSSSSSSVSFTEEELEEEDDSSDPCLKVYNSKTIRCESASIVKVYYKDLGHLYVLGEELNENTEETLDDVNSDGQESLVEDDPSTTDNDENQYLTINIPEIMKTRLENCGLKRWPIPYIPNWDVKDKSKENEVLASLDNEKKEQVIPKPEDDKFKILETLFLSQQISNLDPLTPAATSGNSTDIKFVS